MPYGTISEILWSPDSQAFAVSVSPNAYTETSRAWKILDDHIEEVPIQHSIFADMVKAFPPCAADNLDEKTCKRLESDPEFTLLAVAWANPSILVLMSEIPCSSSYGGIMCQVRGYEVDIRTGKLLRTLSAKEFKRRWQPELKWKFRIPEPPVYKSR